MSSITITVTPITSSSAITVQTLTGTQFTTPAAVNTTGAFAFKVVEIDTKGEFEAVAVNEATDKIAVDKVIVGDLKGLRKAFGAFQDAVFQLLELVIDLLKYILRLVVDIVADIVWAYPRMSTTVYTPVSWLWGGIHVELYHWRVDPHGPYTDFYTRRDKWEHDKIWKRRLKDHWYNNQSRPMCPLEWTLSVVAAIKNMGTTILLFGIQHVMFSIVYWLAVN